MIGAYATAVRCSDFVLNCALYPVQSGIACCFEKGVDFGSGEISRHKDRNMSQARWWTSSSVHNFICDFIFSTGLQYEGGSALFGGFLKDSACVSETISSESWSDFLFPRGKLGKLMRVSGLCLWKATRAIAWNVFFPSIVSALISILSSLPWVKFPPSFLATALQDLHVV